MVLRTLPVAGQRRRIEWLRRRIDRFTAPAMFCVAALFLVFLAGGLQGLMQQIRRDQLWPPQLMWLWWGLLLLYPLFVLELVLHRMLHGRFWKQHLVYCLIPPLRLGGRDHRRGKAVWLPWIGWTRTDAYTRRKVERAFNVPMIFVALSILPVLLIEFTYHGTDQRIAFAIDTATSVIWLAFTFEFIVMISVVDMKLRYCLQHWVDLVIILLPLIAFLRLLRLGQLLRLPQLARATRIYKLRGVTMRAYRAVLALKVLSRIFRIPPEKQLQALRERELELLRNIQQVRHEIHSIELELAAEVAPPADQQPVAQNE